MKEKNLEALPNIGNNLAKKLYQVEIKTAEELDTLGSEKAFIRIRSIDPDACINMLYALQGAIDRIRWHNLSKDKKSELKEFFSSINKHLS